jgi:hypothetical protein
MPIQTAEQQMAHRKVKTQEDYRRLQASQMRALKQSGQDVAVHRISGPVRARVDFGRWIILCPCGAGVAVHPDWTEAYCLGCGAIFDGVVFPAERREIEAALDGRRYAKHQFFFPDRETLEHGIGAAVTS